ncbi:hypothetical protein [Capillimicrobium parvum]|uniref:Uncharacterized protein n=1 Tax=Capillimicrobium parvum TaxID=2884022 RepID=A0A9E7C6E8_9ACTN|nr:hypothetical protein [Capillimicrobium parvum]UGS38939.1 hypothetical protein DSM104329_05371 [Capillimicrobium parvum]
MSRAVRTPEDVQAVVDAATAEHARLFPDSTSATATVIVATSDVPSWGIGDQPAEEPAP